MRHEDTGLENRLKIFRAKYGRSQEDLATAVGVSRKTINTIERGKFTPSTVLALKLADALGCRVEDLFSLNGFGES
ncbi:MAG: helix-turn-helix transcriptional regulator [Pseudomonadota bacterium]